MTGPLRQRSFGLLLLATVGGFGSYTLLLPVIPLWAVVGGAGEIAAGATNGVFMLVTVLTQLGMPWLLPRVGHRAALGLGTALIGIPAPLYMLSGQLWALLGVSGLRGVGFGLLTVAGSALVAEIVPREMRGRAAGWYGMAVGLPNVAFLPAGVWLSQQYGFAGVFAVAGLLPMLTSTAVFGIRRVTARSRVDAADRTTPSARVRTVALVRNLLLPWVVMTTVATAAGGLLAFLPLAVAESIAPVALAAFGLAMMLGRWVAGQLGDRVGNRRAQVPSVVLAAVGLGCLAAATAGSALLALLGAVVFGAGFGAVQNITLVVMFERAESGAASTVWNIAYDAGNGLGSVGFGALLSGLDYAAAFGVVAVVVLLCVPLAIPHPVRR